MVTSRIVGPDGQPIQLNDLAEPQTSQLTWLHKEIQGHPARGLTPSKLAAILDAAENGDVIAQYELFEDMEEKDGHILAEMAKRRNALQSIDWDIVPPRNATAKEKADAIALKDLIEDLPDFEGMLFDVTDAIGKGFACQEIEWDRSEGQWLPQNIEHRPQGWFQLYRGAKQQIRLRDNSADGAPLNPFGWITHIHKARSGYIERASLFRTLVWPYLFKNYSVGDLAEFLEIYGIPVRIGSYPPGAGEKDKMTLLRALASIGHKAAGIIPSGMLIDFKDAVSGDPDSFMAMIDWCERTQSKVILGATLTSQADRGSNTNALGNVHNEVRKDLRDGDARKVARTLSRDLVYPIAALNGLAPGGINRAPQFRFHVEEAEDIKLYSDALPGLVSLGMRIPIDWAQNKLGIPLAEEGTPVLATAAAATPAPTPITLVKGKPVPNPAIAVATAQHAPATRDYVDALVDNLMTAAAPVTDDWIARIRGEVENATDYDDLLARLSMQLTELPLDQLGELVAGASAAAERAGRSDVLDESRA